MSTIILLLAIGSIPRNTEWVPPKSPYDMMGDKL